MLGVDAEHGRARELRADANLLEQAGASHAGARLDRNAQPRP